MSNARDKANIPSLNFSSTGIDDNATSTAITIDSSENVGIGTTSPSGKLDVATGSSGANFRYDTASTFLSILPEDANGDVSLRFRANSGSAPDLLFKSDNGSEIVRFTNSGNVGIGTTTIRTNALLNVNGGINSETGLLGKSLNDSFTLNGQTQPNYGVNFSASIGVPSGISGYRGLAFATSATERMRIDSSGNVGIGTSSPNSQLDITNTTGASGLELHRNFSGNVSGPTNAGGLDFTLTDTATSNQVVAKINAQGEAGTGDAFGGIMRFLTSASSGTSTERMRIDSSGNLKFNSGYGSVATAYGCRAWVNFNGQGTIAIRESGNVSSLTDLGTGFYQINFTTAMPDVNYAVSGMSRGYNDGASNPSNFTTTAIDRDTNSLSTGFVKICAGRTGGSGSTSSEFLDMETQTVAVFR